jgi:hypothetical protein
MIIEYNKAMNRPTDDELIKDKGGSKEALLTNAQKFIDEAGDFEWSSEKEGKPVRCNICHRIVCRDHILKHYKACIK